MQISCPSSFSICAAEGSIYNLELLILLPAGNIGVYHHARLVYLVLRMNLEPQACCASTGPASAVPASSSRAPARCGYSDYSARFSTSLSTLPDFRLALFFIMISFFLLNFQVSFISPCFC